MADARRPMTSRASSPLSSVSPATDSAASVAVRTRIYEDRIARLVSSPRAIAFANARTALTDIFRAANLGPGDEVLLSPLTCKVVPLALMAMGLTPVFADISAATLNLDAAHLPRLAGSRTRAVLFQHTYGSPAGIDAVAAWTRDRALLLVEDCAQCVPLRDPGAPLAGDAAIFSNNLLKPLAAGSGGIAVTGDLELARRLEMFRDARPAPSPGAGRMFKLAAWVHDHVLGPRTYWPLLALNEQVDANYRSRPIATELQTEIAGVAQRPSAYQIDRGICSLGDVERVAAARRDNTSYYAGALRDTPHIEVPLVNTSLPLYYFPVLIDEKPRLLAAARRRSLELIAWPRETPIYPVADYGQLAAYGYDRGSCPVAESVAARLVGLPTHGKITSRHRSRLVALIRAIAA